MEQCTVVKLGFLLTIIIRHQVNIKGFISGEKFYQFIDLQITSGAGSTYLGIVDSINRGRDEADSDWLSGIHNKRLFK